MKNFTTRIFKLWHWISTSSVAIILFPVINYVLTLDVAYLICFLGMCGTHILTSIVKRTTFILLPGNEWVLRPNGASNCDIMCRNGNQAGAPGFPSGHMAHAAFFFTFIGFLASSRNLTHTSLIVICGSLYVVFTGLARYYMKCHNFVQIACGTVFGALLGALCFYFLNAFQLKPTSLQKQ